MNKIKLMNKIAPVGTNIFNKEIYEISDELENYDAIMVRSAQLHDVNFPQSLKAIARCGAGVNNIPIDKCSEQGIVVFNTPGANANGVKELAICSLILASRDIIGGIEWVKTLEGTYDIAKAVEKGKSAFVGNEIQGKTLGVLGLGAIGGIVANVGIDLGMNVWGYDPFLSPNAAWKINPFVKQANSFEQIYKNCDYISIHVPSTPQTKNMINKETLTMMKDNVKIINLARADLVCTDDIKEALLNNKVSKYFTDFPTEETVGVENIINIPHLGASTEESEENCAIMAAIQLNDYLLNGNIKNSVNYPNVNIEPSDNYRICILYKNDNNVISNITNILNKNNINIINFASSNKNNNGYTIIESDNKINDIIIKELETITEIVKIVLIK